MTKITRVVPAILTEDPIALERMVRQAETFTTYVQFDIMDGQFVPSESITGQDLARLDTELSWEVHLMVLHPEKYLKDFRRAGAKKVVFHHEATPSPQKVVSLTRDLGLGVGLALNPDTPVATALPLVDKIDSVLIMTVHPGFYGSQFLPEALDKVRELRSARPNLEIGVDGGIKESNILQVVKAGADVVYVGSAIFLQPQPGETFRRLQALAQQK